MELGPVPTTANNHLLVNFPPLFVGISLLAFGQVASIPPQLAKNCVCAGIGECNGSDLAAAEK